MAYTMAISSQKGGVGKTTTALSLGVNFSSMGLETLLVDLDPQGCISFGFDITTSEDNLGLYQLFKDERRFGEILLPSKIDHLDVVDCGIGFGDSYQMGEFFELLRTPTLLKSVLYTVTYRYDVILIDCPPGTDYITLNALTAADSVIMPIQCEPLGLRTLPQLLNAIIEVQKTTNSDLQIAGILMTMYDSRTKISEKIAHQILKEFSRQVVFETMIPRDIRLSYLFDSRSVNFIKRSESSGANAYRQLATELVGKFNWNTLKTKA